MPTRDELLDGALRHLNADPAASMAEVAEATGVGRATLHRHFTGRADLVHAIGERCLDRWEQTQAGAGLAEATASGDASAITACVDTMVRSLARDAEDFAFALTEHSLQDFPDLVERTRSLVAVEVAMFSAAQRAGVLRPDVPPAWLSHVVYGVMVAVREALRAGEIGSRAAGDLAVRTFLSGASA
ncbi:helix-turn-helix domain-containing protein [Nocardioides sp. W7]|uniref:TetR/AcrR family transcriptional regulator n=1 Tax=Nocardioides sp. W7 TaxID=2931390 RepID=UPI001FD52417|nr:helix-turn-helix domain-containing protein [Nocardioides sp. W7]